MASTLRILDETRINIDGVRELLGTVDNPVSLSTVLRAFRQGHKTPDGGRVYLDFLRMGGKIVSSREAVRRYLAEINGIGAGAPAGPAAGEKRRTELSRAAAECAELTG
jgi:hypothetical protein